MQRESDLENCPICGRPKGAAFGRVCDECAALITTNHRPNTPRFWAGVLAALLFVAAAYVLIGKYCGKDIFRYLLFDLLRL